MLKVIISTFICVFLAELGDKTQIQTMLLAAKSNSILPVFIGASLALVASSVIGVLAGSANHKIYSPSLYTKCRRHGIYNTRYYDTF